MTIDERVRHYGVTWGIQGTATTNVPSYTLTYGTTAAPYPPTLEDALQAFRRQQEGLGRIALDYERLIREYQDEAQWAIRGIIPNPEVLVVPKTPKYKTFSEFLRSKYKIEEV